MNQFKTIIIQLLLICCMQCAFICTHGQAHEFAVGLRMQKSIHLYWENGVAIDYANANWLDKQLHLGFSYCTSRLGTAWHSNAIKQDNYLVYGGYHMRKEKVWQPLVKLNLGYFYADMEYDMFKVLPHQSPLVSFEAGVALQFDLPLRLVTSLGYNFITGDGTSGPGTLYPLFYQFTLQYVFGI
jgi:hypothetical protein